VPAVVLDVCVGAGSRGVGGRVAELPYSGWGSNFDEAWLGSAKSVKSD
jgi:hypothetical protein